MKLFGKEISPTVLSYDMGFMTKDEHNTILTYIDIQRENSAIDRMNREKDLRTKKEMKQLIARKIYNFDAIFGPEKK